MVKALPAGGMSVKENQPKSYLAAGFRQPLQMSQAWETTLKF